MGTSFFQGKKPQAMAPAPFRVSEPNMMARSIAAPNYAAKGDAAVAAKDIAAAAGLYKAARGPLKKSAASDAPGPRI